MEEPISIPRGGQNYVEATDDCRLATYRSLANRKIPVRDGIWKGRDGMEVEVYRAKEFDGLLCVWATNTALASVSTKAQAEAAEWNGHLPCDSGIMRDLGPWDYVGQSPSRP
ncbi:hypothetical protein ABFT80_25935 [Mesorhizobium sp. SB112]|uniref:hypothetical protein n=1 Tax=Mesorhizobium sp. SB112 TaxID=3151853 RepID=UPI0032645D5D